MLLSPWSSRTVLSLVPVRIAELLVMQEALIMAAKFCHMVKHDNRGKGWLMPNKTLKIGNGTGLLVARDELQSNEAINYNHLNDEWDSGHSTFHQSTQYHVAVRLKAFAERWVLEHSAEPSVILLHWSSCPYLKRMTQFKAVTVQLHSMNEWEAMTVQLHSIGE